MFTKYLDKGKILMNLEPGDKVATLKKLLSVSEEKDNKEILTKILDRERIMSTALGDGIALPRVILDNKPITEILIGLSPQGVEFDSLDHKPVKIIILIIFSKRDDYASILAQSLRLLTDESLREDLLETHDQDKIIALIKEWEES